MAGLEFEWFFVPAGRSTHSPIQILIYRKWVDASEAAKPQLLHSSEKGYRFRLQGRPEIENALSIKKNVSKKQGGEENHTPAWFAAAQHVRVQVYESTQAVRFSNHETANHRVRWHFPEPEPFQAVGCCASTPRSRKFKPEYDNLNRLNA